MIATKTSIDVSALDSAVVDKVGGEGYFARDRKAEKKGEEAFFAQGGESKKKEVSEDRKGDQKKVDEALLKVIKKEALLGEYLKSSFSLRKGDKPHEMVF